MKCPICKIRLNRQRYEDIVIHACDRCSGTLVKFDRLKVIESRRDKTRDDLMEELVDAGLDNADKIRCTRCLSTMEKKTRKIGSSQFSIDRCNKCRLFWLDSGELAKLQVIYEFSPRGEEMFRFQDRLKNMTPQEKLDYEERMAKLPRENIAADIVKGVAVNMFTGRYRYGYRDFCDFLDL